MGRFDGVVGCNDAGVVWPGVMDAWVSLHGAVFLRYVAQRDARGLPPHRQVLTSLEEAEQGRKPACITGLVEHLFPGQISSGTSGLMAVKVALDDLGFDRAVLCGMPIQGSAGHLQVHRYQWTGEQTYRRGWLEAMPHIKDRVRSMSGWTRKVLGRPTPEWIAGE